MSNSYDSEARKRTALWIFHRENRCTYQIEAFYIIAIRRTSNLGHKVAVYSRTLWRRLSTHPPTRADCIMKCQSPIYSRKRIRNGSLFVKPRVQCLHTCMISWFECTRRLRTRIWYTPRAKGSMPQLWRWFDRASQWNMKHAQSFHTPLCYLSIY